MALSWGCCGWGQARREAWEWGTGLDPLSPSKGDFVDPCLGDLISILKIPRWLKGLLAFLLKPLVRAQGAGGWCALGGRPWNSSPLASASLGLGKHGLLFSPTPTQTPLLSPCPAIFSQPPAERGADLGPGGRDRGKRHRGPGLKTIIVRTQPRTESLTLCLSFGSSQEWQLFLTA